MDTWINIGIYATYALLGICLLAILGFSLLRVITHPKAAKSALIGIVGLIVLAIIAYAISSGADVSKFAQFNISEGESKTIGAGLIGLYIMMGLAILTIIYVEISRLFNK